MTHAQWSVVPTRHDAFAATEKKMPHSIIGHLLKVKSNTRYVARADTCYLGVAISHHFSLFLHRKLVRHLVHAFNVFRDLFCIVNLRLVIDETA